MTTTPNALRLDRVGQIALQVRDIERAVAFYRDSLGVPFLFTAPPGLAFFRCGDLSLMLSTPESDAEPHRASTSAIYFQVDDVHAAHAALRDRGVSFIGAPHVVHRAPDFELWMAFFRDPDENMLVVMERKPI
ncbi:MAG: VOC family protein [Gemmatimonadaceae bacterium]